MTVPRFLTLSCVLLLFFVDLNTVLSYSGSGNLHLVSIRSGPRVALLCAADTEPQGVPRVLGDLGVPGTGTGAGEGANPSPKGAAAPVQKNAASVNTRKKDVTYKRLYTEEELKLR